MAKVKYYAKENSTIGTHSFYAVPIRKASAVSWATARHPDRVTLATEGTQELPDRLSQHSVERANTMLSRFWKVDMKTSGWKKPKKETE